VIVVAQCATLPKSHLAQRSPLTRGERFLILRAEDSMTEWKEGDSEADPRNRRVLHTAERTSQGRSRSDRERSDFTLDGGALCATRGRQLTDQG